MRNPPQEFRVQSAVEEDSVEQTSVQLERLCVRLCGVGCGVKTEFRPTSRSLSHNEESGILIKYSEFGA
jgi:hypothetical protein